MTSYWHWTGGLRYTWTVTKTQDSSQGSTEAPTLAERRMGELLSMKPGVSSKELAGWRFVPSGTYSCCPT